MAFGSFVVEKCSNVPWKQKSKSFFDRNSKRDVSDDAHQKNVTVVCVKENAKSQKKKTYVNWVHTCDWIVNATL